MMDRIDLHVQVPRMPIKEINGHTPSEPSGEVRKRVIAARHRQIHRTGKPNAQLSSKEIKRQCRLSKEDQRFLEQAAEKLRLSVRAYHRILKAARTIADLQKSDQICRPHVTEALSYRNSKTRS